MDDRDEFDTEGEPPTEPGERVRIIGAQPAGVVAGQSGSDREPGPGGAGDRTEDLDAEPALPQPGSSVAEARPGLHDEEEPTSSDATARYVIAGEPAAGEVARGTEAADRVTPEHDREPPAGARLLHWTDPPTGEVPAVLDRRGSDAAGGPWTGDTGPAWREHEHEWDDSTFDPSLLAHDDTRVGALEETPVEERRPWEFDDLRARVREACAASAGPGAEEEPATSSAATSRGTEGGDEIGHRWWDEEEDSGSTPERHVGGPGGDRGRPEAEEAPPAAPTGVASISSSPLRVGRGIPPGAPHPRMVGVPVEDRERRSMPVAIATGLGFALVAVLAFKAGSVTTLVLSTVVVFLASAECFAALRRSGRHPATFLGLVGTVAVMVAAYAKGVAALPLVLVLVVVTAMLWYLVGADRGSPVEGMASTVFGFAWVGLLGSFAGLMLAPSQYPERHGVAFMLGAAVAAIGADVGALAVGSWVGRHPLAPRVSPNKTWEGVVGGAVLAVALSAGVTGLVHPWTPSKAALLGVVAAVVVPLGDLAESMIKRDLGLKDMGSMLPGHGGVLDRVDGVLFVLPATYYLVRVLHLG